MEERKKLLIATRNAGKMPEIMTKLQGLNLDLVSLDDIEDLPKDFEVEEPAMTFEGNAIIKAVTVACATGLLTLADDSGLEVDALGGRPGVHSARYAPGSDKDRYEKLLGEMEDIYGVQRAAQFRCVIAIYDPRTAKTRTCEGVYSGRIVREPKGENGFGFDPIFFNDILKKTIAEMSLKEKNKISHRGLALNQARKIILREFL